MNGEQTTIGPDRLARSGHTDDHMTVRTQRIEVITLGERRRRWSIAQKGEIVAESLQPGIRPTGLPDMTAKIDIWLSFVNRSSNRRKSPGQSYGVAFLLRHILQSA